MPNKGNRRGTSDLIALLDEPATWVVRGKSGILGNARSLRPALELAARNTNAANPIDCIISATRFDDAQIQVPRRQVSQLLQRTQNGTSAGSKFSPMVSSSEKPRPTRRTPYAWLAWIFSRRKFGRASSSSRGGVARSMNSAG